jgi:hypothetical protein
MSLSSSSGSVASGSIGVVAAAVADAARENAARSSSGSHSRPVHSTIRVASTVTRPRACFSAEGKFGVPAMRYGCVTTPVSLSAPELARMASPIALAWPHEIARVSRYQ